MNFLKMGFFFYTLLAVVVAHAFEVTPVVESIPTIEQEWVNALPRQARLEQSATISTQVGSIKKEAGDVCTLASFGHLQIVRYDERQNRVVARYTNVAASLDSCPSQVLVSLSLTDFDFMQDEIQNPSRSAKVQHDLAVEFYQIQSNRIGVRAMGPYRVGQILHVTSALQIQKLNTGLITLDGKWQWREHEDSICNLSSGRLAILGFSQTLRGLALVRFEGGGGKDLKSSCTAGSLFWLRLP